MKLKKVFTVLTATTTLSAAVLTSSISASALTSIGGYEKFDMERLGMDTGSDYECYYDPDDTATNHFLYNSMYKHAYGFIIKDDVDKKELSDEVATFYTNRDYDLSIENFGDNTCILSIQDFTTLEEEKKTSEKVMKRLAEKDMITSFYDFGELGCSSCFEFIDGLLAYPAELNKNFDESAVKKYLSEKKLDYTVSFQEYTSNSGETYGGYYKISPDYKAKTCEMVDLAYDIYENFGYKMDYTIVEIATITCRNDSLNAVEKPTTKEPPIELPTEDITTEPATEPQKTKLGDTNTDNSVDSKDAVNVLVFYANNLAGKKTEINETIADVNRDNKVDSKDAVLILKYYASNLAGTFNGPIEDFK